MVYLVQDFAVASKLSARQSFAYLKRYKGIDFIDKHYDAEHLLSMEEALEDVALVCRQNGGGIAL